MPQTKENALVIERLTRMGDPRDTWRWHEGEPDYVTELALTQADVPSLVEIARRWGDDDDLDDNPDGEEWSAPIHAWRAAAQLRAVEIVEPLLGMQNRLDEEGDDWHLQEFHHVFGMIGAAAIVPLSVYLADRDNREFARVMAASGLCEMGRRYPETRSRAIEILTGELAKHEREVYTLCGSLVANLLDLSAVESAEVIERAFAAGVVDEMVAGNWTAVREELGVTGLGFVPDRPRPRPQNPYSAFSAWLGPTYPGDRDQRRQKDRKAKAKRKQQKQSRKRNRKRR